MNIKLILRTFFSSLLAGFMIVIGATTFLLCKANGGYAMTVVGAFLFSIGLFSIIHFKTWLYTGKVGYVLDNKKDYFLHLLVCLIGNLLGVFLLSTLIKSVGNKNVDLLKQVCTPLVDGKLNQSVWSCFALSVLCGVMIYMACKGHTICEYPAGKVIFAFLPIVAFILCGFEHVVANGVYFTYAGVINGKTILYFIIMAIGNGVGSILFDGLLKLIAYFEKEGTKTE